MRLTIIEKIVTAILMVILTMPLMTSCTDDNEEPAPNPGVAESGTVTSFNDLQWFVDNFVVLDSEGNLKEYIFGRVLDEAAPQTLYIGVDSESEAAVIFRSCIAPETESQISISQDGSMTYLATDEEGNKQGEIYYKPCGSDEGTISIVTFSNDANMRYIKEIRFISNSLWPENNEIINPYSVGDIYEFTVNEKKSPWKGLHKAVCVKEATKDKPGYLVYFSDVKSFGDWNDSFYPWLPSPTIAQEISDIIRSNWDYYDGLFKSAGMTLNKNEFYWIGLFEKKFLHNRRHGIRLKDSEIDWFDLTTRKPKKPIMMVHTFQYQ